MTDHDAEMDATITVLVEIRISEPFIDEDRGAEDPPDDRWLSIAETFEFLPAEE